MVRGDLRGACGENVVDTVFVGHGKRSLARSAEASGGLEVNAGIVSAAPSIDTGTRDDADNRQGAEQGGLRGVEAG